jgi:hypothetical protein
VILMPTRSERGLTLTELAIVGLLATLVMLGLVGFYMSSQAMWMDASTQAITQREATYLVEEISRKVQAATTADVYPASGGGPQSKIELRDHDGNVLWAFWWAADSLVHEGPDLVTDRGAMLSSKVEAFEFIEGGNMVNLVFLRLRSAQGERVEMDSTRMALQNRLPAP